MAWSITRDVHQFLDAAGDWLRQRPAENTVVLSVSEALRAGGGPADTDTPIALGWWTEEGRVRGAFLHTPPYALVLTLMPDTAPAALAGALADERQPLSQVAGEPRIVDAFVDEWRRRRPGTTTTVAMHQRLYRLGELVDPATPGTARPADAAERDLMIEWITAFYRDLGDLPHGDPARGVDSLLAYGGLTLWTVDGTPVSMASLTRPAGGMVRVGSVYTPPALRRRGYAAAVVAAVSHAARESGTPEVVLFTDLANTTTNAIYQRVGFRPIGDGVILDLHHAPPQ